MTSELCLTTRCSYVDAQLRKSKRFDAAGIQKDHPELFQPLPRRQSSTTSAPSTHASAENLRAAGAAPAENGQLRFWTNEMCSRAPHLFDFVVTLGGDGTVLYTSWLFQRIVPPVLPFALGSLGFLTNFDFADHQPAMDAALDAGIRVNLRMRFTCTVYRAVDAGQGAQGVRALKAVKKAETGEIMMQNVQRGGWEALEGSVPEGCLSAQDRVIKCFATRPAETFEILNDLVVDRGPSPYMSQLELFGQRRRRPSAPPR
jgi:NAD+ kinase